MEQVDPASTELTVASSPAAGLSAQGLTHQHLPAELLWMGQRTQTLPLQAFKIPKYCRNTLEFPGWNKKADNPLMLHCQAVGDSGLQAQIGHRPGGVSRFILICEGSLEQTQDMNSFHFNAEMYHPKPDKHM